MPRLPTGQDLGVRTAQNRGGVVTPSSDPLLDAQGELIQNVKQFTQNVQARRDEMQLHKARLNYQKSIIQAESVYNDPDADMDQLLAKHQDVLSKGKSESLGMIQNGTIREALAQDLGLAELKSISTGQQKIRALEIDRGLADMNGILADSREIAIAHDFNTAIDIANDAITTARGNGYIDAVQEESLRRKYASEVATASISVKPLKEQRELLSSDNPLSTVIPTDARKKLLEDVNGRLVIEEGMNAADEIRVAGGDREQRLAAARKIKDPDVRQTAIRQVEHDLQQEKLALSETQYDAYQTLAKEVIAGKSSAQVITANPQAWDALSAEQQVALKGMDGKAGTNLGVYNELNRLASVNRDAARDYFYGNYQHLSPADAKKWSDRLAKPDELDGYLSRSQRLGRMLNDAAIKKDSDKYYKALESVDQDVLAFEQQHGRKPNPKEEQEILNTVFDKVIDTAWYNPFASDKFGFDLTQEQRNDLRAQGQLEKFEKILSDYQVYRQNSSEVPVILTEEEIGMLYQEAKIRGDLDE